MPIWGLGRSSGRTRRMGGAGKVAQPNFLSSLAGKKKTILFKSPLH